MLERKYAFATQQWWVDLIDKEILPEIPADEEIRIKIVQTCSLDDWPTRSDLVT